MGGMYGRDGMDGADNGQGPGTGAAMEWKERDEARVQNTGRTEGTHGGRNGG